MSKKKKAAPSRKRVAEPSLSSPHHAAAQHKPRALQASRLLAALGLLAALVFAARYFFLQPSRAPQTSLAPASSPQNDSTNNTITLTDFIGADACQTCHAEEYALWKKSTHGNAGGEIGQAHVIAPFNGEPLRFKDAEIIPTQKNGDYIFIIKQNAQPEREIKVAAIVGGGHMHGGGTQSFFMKAEDGTLKFLPFDFIRAENTWFVQLRARNEWTPVSHDIALADLEQWPPHRILGAATQFSNCQNCHGSQILVQYEPATARYVTRYQTLQINCESCHGPGRRHVELMQREEAAQLSDIGMKPLAALAKDESLQVCLQCHATKDAMQTDYLPGKNFDDYYAMKFPILGSTPYLADGRVRAFAYQENHLYSACYLNGSMTCVDCHDPHSQSYRDVWGKPLVGRFADAQCTSCHASKARAVEQHTFHRANSSGSLCVSCHMPYLQHQAVGNKLRFARSDHSIPIPRPAFDAQLGVENACSKCHREQTVAALQKQVEKWYGKIKPHHTQVENFLRAENVSELSRAAELLLNETPAHPMAQVANVSRFVRQYAQPDMSALSADIRARLERLAQSEDLEVQALALMTLHYIAGNEQSVREFLRTQLHEAGAKENALRKRWALAMDFLGVVWGSERKDYAKAIAAHRKALEITPEDEVTRANLVQAYQARGEYKAAIATLQEALRLQPASGNLYALLAQSHLALQQTAEARAAVAEGLRHEPRHETLNRLARQLQM